VEQDRAEEEKYLQGFRDLVRHPSWDLLCELYDRQLDLRAKEALGRMSSPDEAMERNNLLGEISGLALAKKLPTIVIASIEARMSVDELRGEKIDESDDE
jgi:hypothetical protein